MAKVVSFTDREFENALTIIENFGKQDSETVEKIDARIRQYEKEIQDWQRKMDEAYEERRKRLDYKSVLAKFNDKLIGKAKA